MKTTISISATIHAPIEKVWENWTSPKAITKWHTASPDWHTPKAEQDLQPGGKFSYRMEAKDGSFGFDFSGVFDEVKPDKYLEYTLDDDRKIKVNFTIKGNETHIDQSFEAEETNPVEMQRGGWQGILDNFKHYVENLKD
ncbi:SRPBCC family protein [Pedobacter sp. L105]|uniref:SRPBCC family protein n=1 Tax=Pedobacter sp. L105 TaxID=1641871 RepID=UPI00131EBCA5|nr:SRPBCC family protein [Pedobacter sp. L105]